MHFSFVSQLMIFGESDHLTLPQRQQRRPKPGEYFITSIFSQKCYFFSFFYWIFELLLVPIEQQKPPSRPFFYRKLVQKYQLYGSLPHFPLSRPWIGFPAEPK